MASLHYLTVQDVLWINLQITKRVNRFGYASLEDAVNSQYSSGGAEGPLPQAARFFATMLHQRPIAAGNEGTGFVGALAFLLMNGFEITLKDDAGAAWLSRAAAGATNVREAFAEIAKEVSAHHEVDLQAAVEAIFRLYPKTLESAQSKAQVAV